MIGADIAAALPELQAQAESLMQDECEIRAKSTKGVADPDTGIRTDHPGVLWYAGKCRVRRRERTANTVTSGEQDISTASYLVSIPVGTDDVVRGGLVTFTRVADPTLLAATLEVVEPVKGSLRYQRDLWCTLQL